MCHTDDDCGEGNNDAWVEALAPYHCAAVSNDGMLFKMCTPDISCTTDENVDCYPDDELMNAQEAAENVDMPAEGAEEGPQSAMDHMRHEAEEAARDFRRNANGVMRGEHGPFDGKWNITGSYDDKPVREEKEMWGHWVGE